MYIKIKHNKANGVLNKMKKKLSKLIVGVISVFVMPAVCMAWDGPAKDALQQKFPDIIWLDPHAEGNAATVREMLER